MKLQQLAGRCVNHVGFWMTINLGVFLAVWWQLGQRSRPDDSAPSASTGDVLLKPQGGLQVSDPAPDFRLATSDGRNEATVSNVFGGKPVVLFFGSLTCPLFRGHFPEFNLLYAEFKDRAHFYMVYIREAHPEDGGRRLSANIELGPLVHAPKNLSERVALANACAARLNAAMPVLVDDMSNAAEKNYFAFPTRLCIVNASGTMAYISASHTQFNVKAIAAALERALKAGPTTAEREGANVRSTAKRTHAAPVFGGGPSSVAAFEKGSAR